MRLVLAQTLHLMLVSLLIFSLRFAGCKERFLIYAVTIRYKDFVFDHKSFSIRILVAIGHHLENLSTLSSPNTERNRPCSVTLR